MIAQFLAESEVNITAAAIGENAINGDNDAAGWWMENYMYCCKEECPTWLSSIGTALGYATYVEAGAAIVMISIYLAVCAEERSRLNLTLKDISSLAFNSEDTGNTVAAADVDDEGTNDKPGGGGKGGNTNRMPASLEEKEAKGKQSAGGNSPAVISAWPYEHDSQ